MDVQSIKLSQRSVIGKSVKQLRRKGIVPVHVYGSGTEAMSLQSEAQVLRRILPRVGANIPLSVEIEGHPGENICFVREVQHHPVTEDVLHVDFLRVNVSETITAEVPVTLTGEAPAVREGGTLLQFLQSVLVESLPMNVPASIEIDISGLDDYEKAVHASDITLPSNVTLLTELEEMIARVAAPRVEAELEEGELEEGEGGEAEEGGGEDESEE